mmetsp:Transcript_27336/g.42718  ORF Transcript_27336/g.42718 Transcript_27336/m.42718 type:complete len:217 (+) Transcript_27336:20-670(+)
MSVKFRMTLGLGLLLAQASAFSPSALRSLTPKTLPPPVANAISQLRCTAEKVLDRRGFVGFATAGALSILNPLSASAYQDRVVGEIPASGLVFKDTIKVTAFKDPKVEGVELYITDFERPVTERLQKNFFSDPTQASISCAKTGKIKVADDIYKGKEGEDVFEQARSLLFKSLRVRRIYDEESQTLIYVSYSTRLNKDDDDNKSRFKTTTVAVHID